MQGNLNREDIGKLVLFNSSDFSTAAPSFGVLEDVNESDGLTGSANRQLSFEVNPCYSLEKPIKFAGVEVRCFARRTYSKFWSSQVDKICAGSPKEIASFLRDNFPQCQEYAEKIERMSPPYVVK
jgi:hypothetical protein